MYFCDSHLHTKYSFDADQSKSGEVFACCEAALAKGLQEISFTDHYGKAKEVKIAGKDFVKFNSTTWKVSVAGLVVADCRQPVEVKVYDASDAVIASVTDSIESYTARMNGDGPLYVAIMKFAVAAYNYFH